MRRSCCASARSETVTTRHATTLHRVRWGACAGSAAWLASASARARASTGSCGPAPPRKQIVICGFPRSGTSLLYNMLAVALPGLRARRFEASALGSIWRFEDRLSKLPLDVFRLAELAASTTCTHKQLHVLVPLRDPRDLVTSVHPNVPDDYFIGWEASYRVGLGEAGGPSLAMPGIRADPGRSRSRAGPGFDLIRVRYEDLVQDPDCVEERLASRRGVGFARALADFHLARERCPTATTRRTAPRRGPLAGPRDGADRPDSRRQVARPPSIARASSGVRRATRACSRWCAPGATSRTTPGSRRTRARAADAGERARRMRPSASCCWSTAPTGPSTSSRARSPRASRSASTSASCAATSSRSISIRSEVDLLYVFFWGDRSYAHLGLPPEKMVTEVASWRWAVEARYGQLSPQALAEAHLADCATVTTPSRALHRHCAALHPRVLHVPNGFDPQLFHPQRRTTSRLRIGWVGDPRDATKGLRDVLEPACAGRFELESERRTPARSASWRASTTAPT